jgi:hypothetical protein
MKIPVHNNHNRAEEVITREEEELALAKLSCQYRINGLPLYGNLLRPLPSFFGLLKMMEGPGATSFR